MFRVAAIQYCANDNAKDTLAHIQPLIAEAASRATLVTLPECASYLAASRNNLPPMLNGKMTATVKTGLAIKRGNWESGFLPDH